MNEEPGLPRLAGVPGQEEALIVFNILLAYPACGHTTKAHGQERCSPRHVQDRGIPQYQYAVYMLRGTDRFCKFVGGARVRINNDGTEFITMNKCGACSQRVCGNTNFKMERRCEAVVWKEDAKRVQSVFKVPEKPLKPPRLNR